MKGPEPIAESPAASLAYRRSRIALYCSIAIAGCVLDLATKWWVFDWLGEPGPDVPMTDHTWWLIEGYFGIQTAVNTGALFGMGQGGSHWFAAISIAAGISVVVWLFFYGAARDLFLTLALSFVSGGILGNLYDRLGLWNSALSEHRNGVRDWILMQIPGYPPWPNYNIADCLLVCGAIMLVGHAIWYRDGDPQSSSLATKRGSEPAR